MLVKTSISVMGLVLPFFFISCTSAKPLQDKVIKVKLIDVGEGWAKNSVNTTIFRKNSLVSQANSQYIAYYNNAGYVMLGKRILTDTTWQVKQTTFKGNVADAHNVISIMVDGEGYLHMAWDHHNNTLRYCRSLSPGSLDMTEKLPMTGKGENKVSYPEFYKMPNGNLLFFYRDGGSGQGNLVMNQYESKTKQWQQLHTNLIDGEKQRNAYWQAYVDSKGTIHISWVWRESPDVASNHDLAYARSTDGGYTWEKSTGEKYRLPITAATAEYAVRIPQKSELINQTSMSADENGSPFIVTYWREEGSAIPQYHVVHHTGQSWQTILLGFRQTPFSLSGTGSKRIPIARPQVMVKGAGKNASLLMIFRDEERGSKVSVASMEKIKNRKWKLADLTATSVGSWEPSFDTELWKKEGRLHLFVQQVEQADAEGVSSMPSQKVQVLEWTPKF